MLSPGKNALGHATYERHHPEQTLLYQLMEKRNEDRAASSGKKPGRREGISSLYPSKLAKIEK